MAIVGYILSVSLKLLVVVFLFLIIKKYCRVLFKVRKLRQLRDAHFLYGHLKLLFDQPPGMDRQDHIVQIMWKYYNEYRDSKIAVMWLTWVPYIILTNGEAVEAILSSSKVLKKAPEYRYFETWIGTGLLTSAPEKWKGRRKMLTPTFHFRILQDFLKVMNEHSMTLVDIIKHNDGKVVNLFEYIPLTTLDTICETAMGVCVDAQRNPKSDYVNAIVFVNESIFTRFIEVKYWFDFVFFHTKFGKKFRNCVDLVHDFSLKVIEKRKNEILEERAKNGNQTRTQAEDTIFLGSKRKKVAFIDLLINNHIDGLKADGSSDFSLADVCEEVDTFMFEGFETTAVAISWTLHLLGNDERAQNKAYEEI
ncbi:cytochrome P450 4V2-like protein, partial [Dinothrombium tinctorium]